MSETDILVYEFRINESNPGHLEQWCKLACTKARYIVVFDLWSWLTLVVDVMPIAMSTMFKAKTTHSV